MKTFKAAQAEALRWLNLYNLYLKGETSLKRVVLRDREFVLNNHGHHMETMIVAAMSCEFYERGGKDIIPMLDFINEPHGDLTPAEEGMSAIKRSEVSLGEYCASLATSINDGECVSWRDLNDLDTITLHLRKLLAHNK